MISNPSTIQPTSMALTPNIGMLGITGQPHRDDPLGKAAQILSLDGVHHLPIVEDGRVTGLVAQGPVMHAIIAALLSAYDEPD